MPATIASLRIDRLPRDEQLALVQEIWDTIAKEQVPMELTDAQRAELVRRTAEDDATPDDVLPWEQVKTDALAKLQRS